jgi:DNA-binding IclR family transcriptional regulator
VWDEQAEPRAMRGGRGAPAHQSLCAVSKAIFVLRQLDGRAPVGLASLVRSTDIPKSTVRRILRILCVEGMARHVEGGYTLGPLVAGLGRKADEALPDAIVRLVLPHLLELYEATQGVVCLGALCGEAVNCVHVLHRQVDAPLARAMLRSTLIGGTAMGRALCGPRPDMTHVDNDGALVVLAMAVTDRLNRPLAAIAVAGPVGRLSPDAVTPHLRAAVSGASRAIRCSTSWRP